MSFRRGCAKPENSSFDGSSLGGTKNCDSGFIFLELPVPPSTPMTLLDPFPYSRTSFNLFAWLGPILVPMDSSSISRILRESG